MALRPWRLLSLCAGVGGLDLGVRLAEPEARTVCYVEREAPAAAIMVARMEEGWLHPAPIWSDLASFDAGAWDGAVDCVVSGDPCQPNSVAGRGLGDSDDRWLLDRVLDVVRAVRPRRFFRENVPGNAAGQLAVLIPTLEGLGYRVAGGIFSASELGCGHDRERLIVMADAADVNRWGRERAAETGTWQNGERWGRPASCSESLRGQTVRDANCGDRQWNAGEPGWGEIGRVASDRSGGPDQPPLLCPPADPERWSGIISRWPYLEPAIRRVPDAMANRLDELRACGNGVVPLVAGYAWRTLEARLAEAGAGELAVSAAA